MVRLMKAALDERPSGTRQPRRAHGNSKEISILDSLDALIEGSFCPNMYGR